MTTSTPQSKPAESRPEPASNESGHASDNAAPAAPSTASRTPEELDAEVVAEAASVGPQRVVQYTGGFRQDLPGNLDHPQDPGIFRDVDRESLDLVSYDLEFEISANSPKPPATLEYAIRGRRPKRVKPSEIRHLPESLRRLIARTLPVEQADS